MPETVLHVMWAATFVVGSVVRRLGVSRYRREEGIKEGRKDVLDSLLLLPTLTGMFILPVVHIASPWLEFADWDLEMWPALGVGAGGVVVMGMGIWLLWRSHADLGKQWSPGLEIREDHDLVTGGVFGRIRHPMYAAHWVWAVGQVLVLQNWIVGPSMLVLLMPMYFYRVGKEERMMLDHFGEEYRKYMERTGRILPRVRGSREG